jgi:hypothetical protein
MGMVEVRIIYNPIILYEKQSEKAICGMLDQGLVSFNEFASFMAFHCSRHNVYGNSHKFAIVCYIEQIEFWLQEDPKFFERRMRKLFNEWEIIIEPGLLWIEIGTAKEIKYEKISNEDVK